MKHRILTLLCIALCTQCLSAKEDTYFAIAKNLDLFNSIVKELQLHYVDSIPVDKVVQAGINGMLQKLDPYTNYISAETVKDFKYSTTGEYAGIGATIFLHGENVCISKVYEGTPAQKAGLQAGDLLLEIDGKSMKGKKVEDASGMLRGTPGTKVRIKISRPGQKKSFTEELIREHIHVSAIGYAGMLNGQTAYIKLNSFTEDCSSEIKLTLKKLSAQGMQSLILDLRGNPGGLLNEAVNIANLFLPKGETIVTTRVKGNKVDRVYKTASNPEFPELPLVVLVNDETASASEIVSGALQDLDRAVIVGERTYGKGLVQATYPLPYDGQLKVTTSKYYIPSGRCIQARVYDMADSENESEIPDSLTSEFKTRHGRIVRDGRGISPDVCVKSDTIPMIMYYIIEHNLAFDYATEYRLAHDSIAPIGQFDFNDFEYEKFKAYVLASGHPYLSNSEKYLDELIDVAQYEKRYEAAANEFEALRQALHPDLSADLGNDSKYVKMYLSSEILERYYPQGAVAGTIPFDQVLQEAKKILLDTKRYKEILTK
ncbi:MAG: S41 family peptidase [Paludibacteraceae bacterium]|nr:S41 family peptidase [Paludibacteraceae bacterium]